MGKDEARTQTFIEAIEQFLSSGQFKSTHMAYDHSTVYWTYSISEPRLAGWISIYPNDQEPHLTANVNFGILDDRSQAPADLLERNSMLVDGFFYSTAVERLVFVGLQVPLRWIRPEMLKSQLENLLRLEMLSHQQFVNSDFRISPLPLHWIEKPEGE